MVFKVSFSLVFVFIFFFILISINGNNNIKRRSKQGKSSMTGNQQSDINQKVYKICGHNLTCDINCQNLLRMFKRENIKSTWYNN